MDSGLVRLTQVLASGPFAALALFLACEGPAAAQDVPPLASAHGITREVGLFGGVVVAPPEIGRDVNGAGGDILIARLGSSGVSGGWFGMHNRFVGGAFNLFVWLKPVTVRNEAGVKFPYHGKAPVLYLWEGRVYPLGESPGGGVSPYVSAGVGGAFISVDLDNINDQELRHLWVGSVGAGVRFVFDGGDAFLDIQFKPCFLSGRGPIGPFELRVFVVGFGGRF